MVRDDRGASSGQELIDEWTATEEIFVEGQETTGPTRPTWPCDRSGIALLVPDGRAEVTRFESLRGGPVAVTSGPWPYRHVDECGLKVTVFRF